MFFIICFAWVKFDFQLGGILNFKGNFVKEISWSLIIYNLFELSIGLESIVHTAGPTHGCKYLLVEFFEQILLLLFGLLGNFTDMWLQQIETLFAFFIIIDCDVRLNLTENERLLHERN